MSQNMSSAAVVIGALRVNAISHVNHLQADIHMEYQALLGFKRQQQNLKISSAANFDWRFKGEYICFTD